MGAEVVGVSGRLLTLRVSGTLTQPELTSMQSAAAGIIGKDRNWCVLILADGFAGWERGGAWDDFSMQSVYDEAIERMAIVGERKWEDLALLFAAKGLRPFPIEYFEPAQLAAARAWLSDD